MEAGFRKWPEADLKGRLVRGAAGTHSQGGRVTQRISLALVGEYNPAFVPHVKTDEALDQMRSALDLQIEAGWISTAELDADCAAKLSRFDAVWITPGAPYASMVGALNAIRFCRKGGVPLLGTCGGCQYVVIEYARNVLGFVGTTILKLSR
jgi:CTP synthase (UTP-ammonia lyase)